MQGTGTSIKAAKQMNANALGGQQRHELTIRCSSNPPLETPDVTNLADDGNPTADKPHHQTPLFKTELSRRCE